MEPTLEPPAGAVKRGAAASTAGAPSTLSCLTLDAFPMFPDAMLFPGQEAGGARGAFVKAHSTLFRSDMVERIRRNAEGSEVRRDILAKADLWRSKTLDELWESIFGWELKRSFTVLSYGWCPTCRSKCSWTSDPFAYPWKLKCSVCGDAFPKNDFARYHRSGLDAHGLFQHRLADRSLLFNEAAPDPSDPKHLFGVDDGGGYAEGDDRWWFVGCYLCQAAWTQDIYPGIITLARAHLLTGDVEYARRCGVLLDRLADVFPEYDFHTQGIMYEEERTSRGYVVYWCEIVRQLRDMLIAYDQVYEALRDDGEFASYVAAKSERYQTPYRKRSFHDIQQNIEHRLFGDAVVHKHKIAANYPWPEMYGAVAKLVLTEWPADPEAMATGVRNVLWWVAEDDLKQIVERVVRADGMSGEKGFTGYSAIALEATTRLLTLYSLHRRDLLESMVKRYPGLLEGVRFYMNSWMLESYYPGCGDSGYLGAPYRGIPIPPGYAKLQGHGTDSSILYSFEGFLWKLYEITGDLNFVRYAYKAGNYDKTKYFTSDLTLSASPAEVQRRVLALMNEHGADIEQRSRYYPSWKLAILHAGAGRDRRGAYLDYDSGGVHGHNDGMNIGIFAHGMNYLPDYGSVPNHRPGSYDSQFHYWYRSAATHNTVIVDGREHRDYCYVQRDIDGGQGLTSESGKIVLWGIGKTVKVAAADDPLIPAGKATRFERTLALVDVSGGDCYVVDVFRVRGGAEHVKLSRASVCDLKLSGLRLEPYAPAHDPYGMGFVRDRNEKENFFYYTDDEFTFVRNMRVDRRPSADWSAEWIYTDRFKGLFSTPEGVTPTLRYRDLTKDAQVIAYEAFFDSYGAVLSCHPEEIKGNAGYPEEMLPGVAVMRTGAEPLSSTFVGVYEPCAGPSCIASIRALSVVGPEGCADGGTTDRGAADGAADSMAAAVEIRTTNGSRDLFLSADLQRRGVLSVPEWDVETDAAALHVRRRDGGAAGVPGTAITMIDGSCLRLGGHRVRLDGRKDVYEEDLA